jgi:hypothetical protein
MTVRSDILLALAPLVTLASLGVVLNASAVGAAPPPNLRPQNTPLTDPNLFIAPSGQPYRSKAGEPYPVVQWFTATDKNHDGKIDREEFKAEAEEFFHKLDVRKNGIIDDEIIALYEKKVVPEIINANIQAPTKAASSDGNTYSAPPDYKTTRQGAAVYGLLNDGEPLRSADRSFRGMIRLQDMLAEADRNFDELDDDHRGYLTLEDLPRPPAELSAEAARPVVQKKK